MSLIRFAVRNSPLVNIIMVIVFIVGIFILRDIPKEAMPAIDFGSFIIIVTYPGVSPSEMETLVVKKIEDEISDVENVDYISSTCQEARASIFVSFEPDANIDKAQNDLIAELDKVRDLPTDAQAPILLRLNMREINEMCNIALGGDFSANAVREISEDMRDGLLNIPYVSKVEIIGAREREIHLDADKYKLNAFGLTLDDLKNAVKFRNMNVPGGKVNFGKAEFIVRSVGEFQSINDIENLIIRTDANGRALYLKDVATVNDTLEQMNTLVKLNGKPSVRIEVYKKAKGNIISVMKNVRAYVKKFKANIPGLEATVRNDDSVEVQNSIRTLGNNALFGIILVFVILFIFIGWRNALFATWGIPFSFLLTFILMYFFDITVNNLSLFALVLVLGMIVDDAIIVLENAHRYMENGYSPKEAAVKGTEGIMWPVIAAVSTTAAAFLPMIIMKGMMGKFMRIFPIVVSMALFASLFESLVILPSHISDFSKPPRKIHSQSKLQLFIAKHYKRLIKKALRHRFLMIFSIFLAMFLALAALAFRFVKFEFFPKQTPQTIVLKLKTPVGTNLEQTNIVVSKIENYIMNMKEKDDVDAIITTVGYLMENHQAQMMTSNAQLAIDLQEIDKMKFTHDEIKNSIRTFIDRLPGVFTYKFALPQNGAPTGKDVEIRVKGDNMEKLAYIGEVIKTELRKISGVKDIEDSFQEGKKEVKILPQFDKLAMSGLTVAQIAAVVRTASYGSTISKFRNGGVDEYDIVLRLKDSQIDQLEDMKNLKIRNRSGELIALKEVVDFQIVTGLAKIEHRDGKRIITITGDASFYIEHGRRKKRTSDEVTRILTGNKFTGQKGTLSNFSQRFPGYQMKFGGVVEEQKKSYQSLLLAFGIAVLLIYSILATIFKSYVQPLIVMFTIPFAFIGVVFGLLVTNIPFSMNTMIAFVALAGVVVNDSLVLVDFVNRERDEGIDRWNSLINAGAIRLRPIILTTITTIFGVLPMIFSTSKTVRDWKPMAVSIVFGLAFATVLTLFVIPVVYSLVDSLFGKLGLTRFKTHQSYEECVKEDD